MKTLTNFFSHLSAFALVLAMSTAAYAQPANDLCANATTVTCGQTVSGSTLTATLDAAPSCGLNFPRFGVWFRFVGTGQAVTLSTCNAGTNYDSQIGVFSGSCAALTCVAGNDNDGACAAGGRKSTVTFTGTSGTTYFIWVTGAVSARGSYSLSVACAGSVGINCAAAPQVACGQSTTTSLSGSGIWNVTACGFSTPGQEQVYRFTAPTAGTYSLQITGANPSGYIDYFYKSASGDCSASGWTCIDDNFSTGTDNFTLAAGDYYILLDAEGTTARSHTWQINCPTTPPPPSSNDACAGATTITCGQSLSGTTVGATTDGPAASCTGASVAPDRWYVITGDGSFMTASLCTGTSYDSKLDIYTGTCGALASVACNDDFCGLQSQVSWTSVSGVQYLIRVHGFVGATGAFTLTTTCAPTVTNNNGSNNFTTGNVTDLGVDMVGDFYPNPAQNGLSMINVNAKEDMEGSITLFDTFGRIISDRRVNLVGGNNQLEVNVADLAAGTYFAIVRMNNQQFQKKLVVGR